MDVNAIVQEAGLRCEQLISGGKYAQASLIANQMLKVSPESLVASYTLALVAGFSGRLEEAVGLLLKCPDDHRTWNNLGLVYARNNDSDRAIQYFLRACASGEELPRINMALELSKAGQFAEAEEQFCLCRCEHGWFNYGAFLYSRRRFKDARIAYERALAINPGLAVARHNLGATEQMEGKNGWSHLEARFEAFPRLGEIRSSFGVPYGTAGRVVYFNEQGLGDFLYFSRYLEVGSCVAVEWPLRRLAEAMGYRVWKGEPVDSCYSLMSLPLVSRVMERRVVLPEFSLGGGLKVGLCWSGSPLHPNDTNRSMHLRLFECMTRTEGTVWFALGRPHAGRDRGADGTKLVWPPFEDVLDLASIVNSMDVVVTVDTLVAHLAGVLGKRCWLMLPWVADWRWGLGDEVCYSSVRVARQEVAGEWSDVLMAVQFGIITEFLN